MWDVTPDMTGCHTWHDSPHQQQGWASVDAGEDTPLWSPGRDLLYMLREWAPSPLSTCHRLNTWMRLRGLSWALCKVGLTFYGSAIKYVEAFHRRVKINITVCGLYPQFNMADQGGKVHNYWAVFISVHRTTDTHKQHSHPASLWEAEKKTNRKRSESDEMWEGWIFSCRKSHNSQLTCHLVPAAEIRITVTDILRCIYHSSSD